jgi:hypothetical protein
VITGASIASYTTTSAGRYRVQISNASGCKDTSQEVTIIEARRPQIARSADTIITRGTTAMLSVSGGSRYLWSNGATTASITVSPTATTMYSVSITDTNGCTTTDSILVQVRRGTLHVAFAMPDSVYCPGTLLSLSIKTSANSGTLRYEWSSDPADLNSTDANPHTTIWRTTTYIVKVWDDLDTLTVRKLIRCYPRPATPVIQQTGGDLKASPGVSFRWFLNGVLISGATSMVLTRPAVGSYTVQSTDSNGCQSDVSDSYVFSSSGTDEIPETQIQLLPNPAQNTLILRSMNVALDNVRFSISDAYGRKTRDEQLKNIIDVSGLIPGVYQLWLAYANGSYSTHRFVIIR